MEMRCLSEVNYFLRDLVKWHTPPIGWVKANTDAAIGDDGQISVGVVMRDDKGFVVAALMAHFLGLPNAFYGEVLAIKECMLLIHKCSQMKIMIETDAHEVVQAITQPVLGELEAALNVKYIQESLQKLPWWKANTPIERQTSSFTA